MAIGSLDGQHLRSAIAVMWDLASPPKRPILYSEELAISRYVPEAGKGERHKRARIYRARDAALSKSRDAVTSASHDLYILAADVASQWVFRRGVCEADLQELLHILSQFFIGAAVLERLERNA